MSLNEGLTQSELEALPEGSVIRETISALEGDYSAAADYVKRNSNWHVATVTDQMQSLIDLLETLTDEPVVLPTFTTQALFDSQEEQFAQGMLGEFAYTLISAPSAEVAA